MCHYQFEYWRPCLSDVLIEVQKWSPYLGFIPHSADKKDSGKNLGLSNE
ncbi:MAG: hypothetical protein VXY06_05500 [Bacteroidota bacterium]|nr:hypothetical protein [Bacteroidota bacterium]